MIKVLVISVITLIFVLAVSAVSAAILSITASSANMAPIHSYTSMYIYDPPAALKFNIEYCAELLSGGNPLDVNVETFKNGDLTNKFLVSTYANIASIRASCKQGKIEVLILPKKNNKSICGGLYSARCGI